MSNPKVASTSISTNEPIDRLCERFETEWRSAAQPRIEQYLAEADESLRELLLGELLRLEIELRGAAGESPLREEYDRRFPDDSALLDQLWSPDSKSASTTAAEVQRGASDPFPTVLPSAETLPDGVSTATRYLALRAFREGGLGILCLSNDTALRREVVVKFPNAKCQSDPRQLEQFKAEAEITGRLDHPSVVPVYGVGEDWNGRPFYVMRRIHGRELRQAIVEHHNAGGPGNHSRENRQQLFELLEHLASACNTVAYAHSVGIVHCDLKPSNIMIGKHAETFVLDWGLAASVSPTKSIEVPGEQVIRPSGSQSSQRGGTYGYISPEQLSRHEAVTPRSDVYSLGATLYEVLTGKPAFDSRNPNVVELVVTGQFKRPRDEVHAIPRKLEAICLKAMALAPDARYRTAKHMAADLQAWIRDDEVTAAPERLVGSLFRFARRHRGMTLTAILATLLLAVTGTWAHLARRHAQQEVLLRKHIESSLTTALDTLEELSLPLANGELNNLDLIQPYSDTIQRFTSDYFSDPDQASSPQFAGRVYALDAAAKRLRVDGYRGALSDYAQAETIFKQLTASEPANFDFAMRLARIELGRGWLLVQRSELAAADEALVRAKDQLEQLDQQHPHDPRVMRFRGEAYQSLGEVYQARQRGVESTLSGRHDEDLAEALKYFKLARNLRQELVGEQDTRREQHQSVNETEESTYKRDLARSLAYLGNMYLARGSIAAARRNYDASLALREELYKFNPRNAEQRFQFARGLGNFGVLERDYEGNLADARSKVEKAIELQRGLASEFANVDVIQADLGRTLNMLAEILILSAVREPTSAATFRQRAGQLLTDDGSPARCSATIYARLAKSDGLEKPDRKAVNGLATALVFEALLDVDRNQGNTSRKTQQAIDLLVGKIAPVEQLSYEELFTLAMARALHDEPQAAFETLRKAVNNGLNAAARIEGHRTAAFRSIVAAKELAGSFDALVTDVKRQLQAASEAAP